MGIKIYVAIENTTLNGELVRKGTEVPFSEEPRNVNFKFVREEGNKTDKTTIKK